MKLKITRVFFEPTTHQHCAIGEIKEFPDEVANKLLRNKNNIVEKIVEKAKPILDEIKEEE